MFFNKKENDKKTNYLIKIGALLIHAAKIDEEYSESEEKLIKNALLKLGANEENLNLLIEKAKKIEEDSNQILDFTREIKKQKEIEKIKIIEILWRIIYSNKEADIYETNLMRRLSGLLYVDSKIIGDIKEKIKNENL
tara:strand:+ start:320 stop:733 length:414 start_codon:yes stop_codon:yes gene_type:complete